MAAIGTVPDVDLLVTKNTTACEDLISDCPQRGVNGECDSNPAFMLVMCPTTCDSCLPQGKLIFLYYND